MGYIRHDAIIVTTWQEESLAKAHKKAKDLNLAVSEIVESPTNGYVSFLIAPDGSKEGWEASKIGEESRRAWKKWVKNEKGLFVDWVHVDYGGDDPHASIIEYADKEER